MTEWHDSSCRRPDVFTNGGISSCLSCGCIQLDPGISPQEHTEAATGAIYQPLESKTDIRLLTLEPGDFNDPIKCRLSLGSTASMVDYDAISYTWASEDGAMEWTKRITLNSREFFVTPNCKAALRRVRSRGAQKVIWIDAVCMNQKDIEERGHQVRLMPQIYSRAKHVLIYIGEPVPEEERLLRFLHNAPDPGLPRLPLQLALETLLTRRYFSRAWILQEVALARNATLICGSYTVPWSTMQIPRLVRLGLVINAEEKPRLLNLLQMPSVLQFRAPAYRDSADLLRLLDLARHSHATDPRDKLFAVFGLISCAESDGIVADYTKSTREVYMRMAGWIAQRFGVPALLVRAFHLGQFNAGNDDAERYATSESIPPWTPNWMEKPAPRMWPVLAEMHQESKVGLAPAGLPVSVNLAADSLRFPVFGLGKLSDIIDEHTLRPRSETRSDLKQPWQPWQWPYTTLNANRGNKTCGQENFVFNTLNQAVEESRRRRYREIQVYLLPEPDEYSGFLFTGVGNVSVCVEASSCTWTHEGREGRRTVGRFSKFALCAQDLGWGDVRENGLLHMDGLAHEGIWKTGHFEYINLVGEDTAPYPARDTDIFRLAYHRREAAEQRRAARGDRVLSEGD